MEKKLGIYLKEMRLNAGLSQGEVAKRLNYKTAQFISNWERGLSEPPITTLKKLSELYHVDIEDLFEITLKHFTDKITTKMRRRFFWKI